MGKVHENDQIIKVLTITMMIMMMMMMLIIKIKIIIITTIIITLIKLIMTGIISITKKILCSNNKMILRPTKS